MQFFYIGSREADDLFLIQVQAEQREQENNVPFIFREQEADPRYTFVLNSFTEFFKNLGFVSNDNFAYYITFPNKGYTNNIFVNDSTNAFPLIYTAVGAGLVAYVSE